jgi:glycosyltransferase involved in cell wall biosynthesis
MSTLVNRSSHLSLSIVVPAYNESTNLTKFVTALKEVLVSITPRYEILIINDGSKDNTE